MTVPDRVVLLVVIFLTAIAGVTWITLTVLHDAAFNEQRLRMVEIAQSEARIVEAVYRHESGYSQGLDRAHGHGKALSATLDQIRDAHSRFRGFGETWEFTLAMLQGDQIVFLLRHRHKDLDNPESVPLSSSLAEPMRRALKGECGTIVGLDYRGERVLAAFEPLDELGLGIVAKIDLSEIRAPFLRAGMLAVLSALLLAVAGSVLFFRITNPIIVKLQRNAEDLELEIAERRCSEAALERELFENQSLAELSHSLIAAETSGDRIASLVLECAKALTRSEHGFVASIDPASGDCVAHTLTAMMGLDCMVTGPDQRIRFPIGQDGVYPALWGHALNARAPFVSNSPQDHERSKGVPQGHIPLQRFLAVPALVSDRLVGQIALANSLRDYSERDVAAVRRLAELYALSVQRRLAEEAVREAEEALRRCTRIWNGESRSARRNSSWLTSSCANPRRWRPSAARPAGSLTTSTT